MMPFGPKSPHQLCGGDVTALAHEPSGGSGHRPICDARRLCRLEKQLARYEQ